MDGIVYFLLTLSFIGFLAAIICMIFANVMMVFSPKKILIPCENGHILLFLMKKNYLKKERTGLVYMFFPCEWLFFSFF